ncbi:MAG: sugar phosphate isomerase/epimerase family protein [Planctomycetota bacterium]
MPHRRQFLHRSLAFAGTGTLAIATLPVTQAVDPIDRAGGAKFRYSLAAYSLRKYFAFMKGKPKQPQGDGPPLNMHGFIDYCREQGFDAAELTSYFFDAPVTDDTLRDLKRHAFLSGVAVTGTAIGNNFTLAPEKLPRQISETKEWIRRASVLGAPHIRIFAGTGAALAKHPERFDGICSAVEACAEVAAQYGIFLGVENHGNLSSDQMLRIIKRIESPWVGINLDTGNFFSETPYNDIERCLPYAVNVQVKTMMRKPNGDRYPANFDRLAQLLVAARYQGDVVLEFEEADAYQEIPPTFKALKQAITKAMATGTGSPGG